MDAETIRNTAVSKGMISPEDDLPETELFGMIFAPGFSTAKTVTDVSGRGVGMDVVKQGVEGSQGGYRHQQPKRERGRLSPWSCP